MASRFAELAIAACALLACAACGEKADPAASATAGAGGSAGGTALAAAGASPSGSGGSSAGAAAGGASAASDDPDPVLTDSVMTALRALRYDNAAVPPDPSNKYGDLPAARTFGQRLFFDRRLSGRLLEGDNDGSPSTLGVKGENEKVSCAGCHVPQTNFVDTRSPHQQISLAAQWTRRRTPTLLEVGFASLYNWDGRRDSIWAQAIGVFESVNEYNSSRLFIAQQTYALHRAEYESIFGEMPKLDDAQQFPPLSGAETGCDEGPVETAACRGKPGDKADYDGMTPEAQKAVTTVTVNVAKALDAYVRQLRCGSGRFDAWLDGDDSALSRSEQRGAALFVGSAKCVSCHSGPNLTDSKFHNVGLRPATVAVAFTDTDDRGAGEAIPLTIADPLNSKGSFSDGDRGKLPSKVDSALEGAFRTPTLRCAANHPSFMHTGQHTSLAMLMRFFNRGGDPAGFPGTNELEALNLTDREQADLIAFMQTLQGPGPNASLLAPPP
ncbi:MAG TPA: cytochrome c peroxidase [Polyangiaceae bacterium]|nr:cytochrome c peroxidase [Polyangiaceae bacterium]